MSTGIKINGNTVIGTKAQLVLIKNKYKYDGVFRHNVGIYMEYNKIVSAQDVYTAEELLKYSQENSIKLPKPKLKTYIVKRKRDGVEVCHQ